MANYLIYLDSSTQNNKNVSYGASTVAWTIRCNSKTVSRTGLAYSHLNGPNKIIYEGILAAISTLEPENFYAGGSDNVNIYVDSQVVINQLNGSFVAKKNDESFVIGKRKMCKASKCEV